MLTDNSINESHDILTIINFIEIKIKNFLSSHVKDISIEELLYYKEILDILNRIKIYENNLYKAYKDI